MIKIRTYSPEFKQKVVLEVLKGKLTKEQARTKYGIKGNSAVLNWIRQYKREKKERIEELKDLKNKNTEALTTRLKHLEREYREAKVRAELYKIKILEIKKLMMNDIENETEDETEDDKYIVDIV